MNEEKYATLRKEILDESEGDEASGEEGDEEEEESEVEEGEEGEKGTIIDKTETNLVCCLLMFTSGLICSLIDSNETGNMIFNFITCNLIVHFSLPFAGPFT